MSKQDRYLQHRASWWHYVRRIPKRFQDIDDRHTIRRSLKTQSIDEARARRDAFEETEDQFWASSILGDPDLATIKYKQALLRAELIGVRYMVAEDIAQTETVTQIIARSKLTFNKEEDETLFNAAFGGLKPPPTTLDKAFNLYRETIAADELEGKSDNQLRKWTVVKQGSITLFKQVVKADIPIGEVTRDHGLQFYKHLLEKLKAGAIGTSMAKRRIGDLRALYREYYIYMGEEDRPNPFRNLSFKTSSKRVRPPFSDKWLIEKFTTGNALATINDEARLIIMVMIETGARPSEIANLRRNNIHLNAEIPFISIAPTDDIEIKTETSIRNIPLVGIALEAMKQSPEGFPRYYDKTDAFSGMVNKFCRENGLLETDQHSLYCIRHSFERRMKEKGVDFELRCRLMGHGIDRPKYGYDDDLTIPHRVLSEMALPFSI
ncbi:MAG: tyrosine-type recombinase/integrase [Lentilitoribacter sp.]